MNVSDARKAHKILDDLIKGNMVLDKEREFLRSALPELPAQKTLAEIIAHVDDAWIEASGNEWAGNSYDPDVSIEDWLDELHVHLKGLKDAPATKPALPAGMRLADHEVLGRVVVSPTAGKSENYLIFILDSSNSNGANCVYEHYGNLAFIDPKPAHPEFLETEADYRDAPLGTVVARDGYLAWTKEGDGAWACAGGSNIDHSMVLGGARDVLRWGWGK